MPQFDTFSFFSQLFWVFLGFLTLYLLLCFYLLPALATILKVRKRKLNQITSNSDAAGLSVDSGDKSTVSTTDKVAIVISWLNSAVAAKLDKSTNSDNLSYLVFKYKLSQNNILKFAVVRDYNFKLFNQAQQTTIFWN